MAITLKSLGEMFLAKRAASEVFGWLVQGLVRQRKSVPINADAALGLKVQMHLQRLTRIDMLLGQTPARLITPCWNQC